MGKIGKLKINLVNKLIESYSNGNLSDMRSILKEISKNKNLKDLFLFYEEIEEKTIDDDDIAKLYVEQLSNILNEKYVIVKNKCEELISKLDDNLTESNDLYDLLDILTEDTNLNNLDLKIKAKKDLIEYLKKPKPDSEVISENFTENEALLYSVLTNNFNNVYNRLLNEDEKGKLKFYASLTDREVVNMVTEAKQEIKDKINTLKEDIQDEEIIEKLNLTLKEVDETSESRYDLFRLNELKKDLV